MPSSLTWFISNTLVFSTCLPVSVCGTDATNVKTLRRFSWQQGIYETRSSGELRAHHFSALMKGGFAYPSAYGLGQSLPIDCSYSRLRHSITGLQRYRNINLLSIDYAFRPRLRVRLTLGGFTVPRKPWVFGEQDSHLLYRYLSRHNHFQNVQASLPSPFTRLERSPTPDRNQRFLPSRSFG